MSNDVPTKPGYYRDFEGDIWRLEEEGVNNWTLRPGQPLEERYVYEGEEHRILRIETTEVVS